jgi:hypothetical protein
MIPPLHTPDTCPACSVGVTCRLIRTGHLRYWDLYQADPGKWGPILLADAIQDRDYPLGDYPPVVIPERENRPRSATEINFPCKHRTVRWGCNGECTMACARGKGQAGIVDPQDCSACDEAEG